MPRMATTRDLYAVCIYEANLFPNTRYLTLLRLNLKILSINLGKT
jgi:hypothetical protein